MRKRKLPIIKEKVKFYLSDIIYTVAGVKRQGNIWFINVGRNEWHPACLYNII